MCWARRAPLLRACCDTLARSSNPALLAPACPCRRRVAAALEAGIVWVNCSQPCFVQAPWGGVKASGNNTRELGPWGLEGFLAVKQVTEYVSNAKWDWFPQRSASPRL